MATEWISEIIESSLHWILWVSIRVLIRKCNGFHRVPPLQ